MKIIDPENCDNSSRDLFYAFTALFSAAALALISLLNMNLNTVLTNGCMNRSCEKNANGRLKHTSLNQWQSNTTTLKPSKKD